MFHLKYISNTWFQLTKYTESISCLFYQKVACSEVQNLIIVCALQEDYLLSLFKCWMTTSLADLRGYQGLAPPPQGSKFIHFYAALGKKNCKIIPIWDLAHPPQENPGSVTLVYLVQGIEYQKSIACGRLVFQTCGPQNSIPL